MERYKEFSYYYDLLMKDCDYEKWSQYLISEIKGKGIDFACGSGKMTIPLKKAGFDLIGVDISADMLKVAGENARKEGVKIDFILSDMTKFTSPKKVDFALCMLDGVNYLNKLQVKNFFNTAYKNLNGGGKFIFDISSKYKLLELIGDKVFYLDQDNVTYLWTNKLPKDKSYIMFDIVFFVKEGNLYRRFDEQHKLHIYEKEFLEEELKNAGFTKIKVVGDNFKNLSKTSKRIIFTAIK